MALQQHHREHLEASGLSPEVIEERGYFSAESASALERLGFARSQRSAPALVIPLRDARGEIVSYQARPDHPRMVDGRALKYESRTGDRPVLDIPPRCREMLVDPQVPLFITEGAKKADAAASRGLCCVNVSGVWSWRGSNSLAGRTALPDWETVALNGGRPVYLVFDSDVTLRRDIHAALSRLREFLAGRGAQVRIVYLPPGPHGEKMGLDDYLVAGHTPQDLLGLASEELREAPREEDADEEGELPYQIRNGQIWWHQLTKDGERRWRPLCRFAATVTRNILEDDGTGQPQALFEVEARYNGRQVTTTLSPEQFDTLHWPAELLGAGASIYPGQSVREHTRFAIRRLSGDPEWHHVYTHTGWRQIEGEWVYLHTGGGVGGDGLVGSVEVRPPKGMERYRLPEPGDVEAQREAVRRSLGMLEVSDERSTLPLLAAVYTAPLGEILHSDYVVWLYGESGSRKSTMAALALSHYGRFERSSLPANFTSTVNAVEGMLHAAKDTLLVIDDYAPPADRRARDQMEGLVHRLLRAVGDNRGRQRMTADAKLRGEKPARGMPLVTAELRPAGVQSAEARTFTVQWERGAVNLDRLTRAQEEDAPYYPTAMAGYLAWLAPQLDALRTTLPGWVRAKGRELAQAARVEHGRVAETGAKLLAGWGAFIAYAEAVGAVSTEQAAAYMERARRAVIATAQLTSGNQADKRPSALFRTYLRSLMFQRLGHLRDRVSNKDPDLGEAEQWGYEVRTVNYGAGSEWVVSPGARSEQIGWVDDTHVYLKPVEAHRAVMKYAQGAGVLFPATKDDLGEALLRDHLLVDPEKGRTTSRVSIGGVTHRVWRLARQHLTEEQLADPPGPPGGPAPDWPVDLTTSTGSGQGRGQAPSLVPVGESGTLTAMTADTSTPENNACGAGGEAAGGALHTKVVSGSDSSGHSGQGSQLSYSPNGLSLTATLTGPSSERSSRSSVSVGGSLPEVPLTMVTHPDQVGPMLEALAAAPVVGMDLETTGLSPRQDRARLVSLATGASAWVVDLATVPAAAVVPHLEDLHLVTHNGKFDLGFLMASGFQPGRVADTMLLSQLLHAGQPAPRGTHSLAGVARRWLDVELPKDLQKSKWDGVLTEEQLAYAARDAVVLLPLHERLMAAAAEAELQRVVDTEHRCLPAVTWMGLAGVPLDREAWVALAGKASERMAALEEEMNAIAPKPPGLDLGVPWQWGNPAIVKRVFAELGIELGSTGDAVLAALEHPLADLVRKHRKEQKLLTTYGESWPSTYAEGRIYCEWQQLGAEATGRMSCREPNVQQMPRAEGYRQCVVAPPGRVLVTADYSQIELRIACRIAGERRMLEAYQQGQDLHSLTASVLLGKPVDQVSKADRQIAKSANFGLLYGMGAPGYQAYAWTTYGVRLTPQQAQHYRALFLMQLYPGLQAWHERVRREHAPEVRTLTGRRRVLSPAEPDTRRLNTPVQGTGADGLKSALALLWERRDECPGAVPVIACHDEIVVECAEDQADAAKEWVRRAMVDGIAELIAPVPVEVEPCVGDRWEK